MRQQTLRALLEPAGGCGQDQCADTRKSPAGISQKHQRTSVPCPAALLTQVTQPPYFIEGELMPTKLKDC